MVSLIIGCEVGFWLCLIAGLAVRYLVRAPRASVLILLGAPALDVVLLVVTAISLKSGTAPEIGHAIAAIYLGFSVAYGHRMIKWADVRFAHYFDKAPAPRKVIGAAYAKLCWEDVARTGLAAAIACGVTAVLMMLAKPGTDTTALTDNYRWMLLICGLEVAWAVSYTIWPRRAKPYSSRRQSPAPRP